MATGEMSPRQGLGRQGFYRHLLLVCVLAILALQLPGSLARLSWLVLLDLTILLGLRLGRGSAALLPNPRHRARFSSHLYRVLALVSACGPLIWLVNPGRLTPLLLPLLALFISSRRGTRRLPNRHCRREACASALPMFISGASS